MPLTAAAIKDKARELGFDLCGVTPAKPSPTLIAYLRWIERGMHGAMSYMARVDRVRRRQDLREILPGAKSLILVGMDYYSRFADEETLNDPARGRIAAYAWGLDYHKVLELRLEQFAEWLAETSGPSDIAEDLRRYRCNLGAQPRPASRTGLHRQEHHAHSSAARQQLLHRRDHHSA